MKKKRVDLVLVVAMIVIGLAGIADAELVQWAVEDGGNGHFYEAVAEPDGITWADANEAAVLAGGHLVTITSREENDFVYSLIDDDIYWHTIPAGHQRGPWLGGYQPQGLPEPAGGWQWLTGEAFTYTNWALGQPDDWQKVPTGEESLHFMCYSSIKRIPTWNDYRESGLMYSYVIEFPTPAIEADINIYLDTLNLANEGSWITCYMWLDEEHSVADIEPNSIMLEEEIAAEWMWFEEKHELVMAKFRRSAVVDMLVEFGQFGPVELLVTGRLTDGTRFEGTDVIKVIDEEGKKDKRGKKPKRCKRHKRDEK